MSTKKIKDLLSNTETMTFLDFFSGIGGFHSGLEKAGMKCIGWCEFDKFAQKSYNAMYDTEGLYFSDNIRKCNGKELPKSDLWAFGFPCQDISIAGNQRGIKEGTRSGLFFEVMRLLDEIENPDDKPKWLIAENVKNLLSIDKGHGFYTVLSEMAKRGYTCEWKIYNSKNYGVPQNRERVYLVGYYGNPGTRSLLPKPRKSKSTLNQIIPGHQGSRVYDAEGIAPTLMAQGGTQTSLYKLPSSGIHNFGKSSAYENNNTVWATGNARTLTASDYKHVPQVAVQIKNATDKGYVDTYIGDGIDLSYVNSKTKRGRVQPQQSQTLTVSGSIGVLVNTDPIQIRKLTPRECWRLQGFTDAQYDAAAEVNSKSQLYKQAGNAVTVNVVEAIGNHIVETNQHLLDDLSIN